jgi:CHAT domain-containing protein/tetratricopeptide (TPR) repeat protein
LPRVAPARRQAGRLTLWALKECALEGCFGMRNDSKNSWVQVALWALTALLAIAPSTAKPYSPRLAQVAPSGVTAQVCSNPELAAFGHMASRLLRDAESAAEDKDGDAYVRYGNVILDNVIACRTFVLDPARKAVSQLVRITIGVDSFELPRGFLDRLAATSESILGPDHPNFAASLSKIGVLLIKRKQFGEAEKVCRKALKIQEKTLGPNHRDIGITLGNLVQALQGLGRAKEAEKLGSRQALIETKFVSLRANLNTAVQLFNSDRFAEAAEAIKPVLPMMQEQIGEEDTAFADALEFLARSLREVGNMADSELYFKRALAVRENIVGPYDLSVAKTVSNFGSLLNEEGRYAEADMLSRRALEIERSQKIHLSEIATTLHNLAVVHKNWERFEDAASFQKEVVQIQEQMHGRSSLEVAAALVELAHIHDEAWDSETAIQLFRRALTIRENELGPGHHLVAATMQNLATSLKSSGQYAQADSLLKRALAIEEKVAGADGEDVITLLVSLAIVHGQSGRADEAEPLYRRALSIRERQGRLDDPQLLNNLGSIYRELGRHQEAESMLKRAVAASKEAEKGLPSRLKRFGSLKRALGNLGLLYRDVGRYADAEAALKQSVAIDEETYGVGHRQTAVGLENLATVYLRSHRYAQAELLYKRALAIKEAAKVDESFMAANFDALAELSQVNGLLADSLAYSRRSTQSIIRMLAKDATRGIRSSPSSYHAVLDRPPAYFLDRHLALLYSDASARETSSAESFSIGQWAAYSSAATALQQSAIRSVGNDELRLLLREQQDATSELRRLEQSLIREVAKAPGERRPEREGFLRGKIAGIEKALQELTTRIASESPQYIELMDPRPANLSELILNRGEVLVFFHVTNSDGFTWIINQGQLTWQKMESVDRLDDLVRRVMRPFHEAPAESQGFANDATGEFDLAAACELYRVLFGTIEDRIKDAKHLIIVPDRTLTGLPFQLLVKEAPLSGTTFKTAHWLIRDHAVSVLPAVSSLRALRGIPRRAQTASLPFIGFGDPLIGADVGEVTCSEIEQGDRRALPVVAARRTRRAPALEPAIYVGGGFTEEGIAVADVDWLRRQTRLADSRCELEAMARLRGPGSAVYVGEEATEKKVKELSAKGELRRYRVLAFATHGLLPEQAKAVAEAALILTPPRKGSPEDDGLLTASEVTGLDLDADWVILSACNTASGDKPGAATLSGLARAFFYAGARSLLVSHWPVESQAAVLLTTRTLRAAEDNGSIGKAEALRRAMLSFLADDVPDAWSNPRIWAPFSLVGEGQ